MAQKFISINFFGSHSPCPRNAATCQMMNAHTQPCLANLLDLCVFTTCSQAKLCTLRCLYTLLVVVPYIYNHKVVTSSAGSCKCTHIPVASAQPADNHIQHQTRQATFWVHMHVCTHQPRSTADLRPTIRCLRTLGIASSYRCTPGTPSAVALRPADQTCHQHPKPQLPP